MHHRVPISSRPTSPSPGVPESRRPQVLASPSPTSSSPTSSSPTSVSSTSHVCIFHVPRPPSPSHFWSQSFSRRIVGRAEVWRKTRNRLTLQALYELWLNQSVVNFHLEPTFRSILSRAFVSYQTRQSRRNIIGPPLV